MTILSGLAGDDRDVEQSRKSDELAAAVAGTSIASRPMIATRQAVAQEHEEFGDQATKSSQQATSRATGTETCPVVRLLAGPAARKKTST
jgi:hypothetical protein